MADQLTVNFDELTNAISSFKQAHSEMVESYKNAEKALELLRSTQWHSLGKERYFEMVDTSSAAHEKCMTLVSEMIVKMTEAQSKYEAIYESIPKLADSLTV